MPNTWHQLQQLSKHLFYASSAITRSLLHLDWFLGFFFLIENKCTSLHNHTELPFFFFLFLSFSFGHH